jgi:hypothetical protein
MPLKKMIDADKICVNLWFLRNLRPISQSERERNLTSSKLTFLRLFSILIR